MAKDKKTEVEEPENAHEEALRAGVWIFLMLGVLTAGEFLVAVIAPPWTSILWMAAIWKAYYVVVNYMHIGRAFGGGEETH